MVLKEVGKLLLELEKAELEITCNCRPRRSRGRQTCDLGLSYLLPEECIRFFASTEPKNGNFVPRSGTKVVAFGPEAPIGGATPQTYTQLLAVYLYQNDICNAKYLWKRIPDNVKANSPELQQVWLVGQRMWQRDWPAVHAALSSEWSEDINSIMNALKDSVRDRAITLISEAYSSLTLTTLAGMTGLSVPDAQTAAVEKGWKIDGDMVQPRRIDKEQSLTQTSLTEDQLYKLTQFVSFLEN